MPSKYLNVVKNKKEFKEIIDIIDFDKCSLR